MKTCGHDSNPPNDVDQKGRPYGSCYFCFIRDIEKFQDWYESLRPKSEDEKCLNELTIGSSSAGVGELHGIL